MGWAVSIYNRRLAERIHFMFLFSDSAQEKNLVSPWLQRLSKRPRGNLWSLLHITRVILMMEINSEQKAAGRWWDLRIYVMW